ncbi:MAG: hypothetical protein EAZ57_00095 [Cytophagales bacterium]|nr:MAG: hypothetical protein EAZ67_04620 [Cytophagales bacterium]TAF62537.1 MAG: hypothetical protein EAZ57_00095 [Cytophagales bacterium]
MNIRICALLLTLFFCQNIVDDCWAQEKTGKRKKRKQKTVQIDDKGPGSLLEINNQESVANETADIAPKQILAEQALIEGMKWYLLDEYTKAASSFQAALKIDDKNDAASYQLALCYFRLGEPRQAISYIETAVKIDGNNHYYLRLLANVYEEISDNANAEKVWRNLIQKAPKSEEYYYSLADLLKQVGKTKDVIKVYDQAEAELGFNEEIIRRKQEIYLANNNLESALKEGQKLIEAFPDYPDYILMQAELMLNNRRVNESKNLINSYLGSGFSHPYAFLMLAEIANSENDKDGQYKYLEQAFSDPDLGSDQKIRILLTNYYDQSERNAIVRTQGTKLAFLAANAHPESADLWAVYADFLFLANQKVEARSAYLKSTQQNPDNYRVWERILQVDLESGQIDSLVKHGQKVTDLFPYQPSMWFYYGMGLLELNQVDEALEALEQARSLTANDKLLASDVETLIGDLHNRTKAYDKSDRAYEAAIAANPNNARALNNYSYYLALRKDKLPLAEQMSIKLIRLYPNDANFLDTHAWVLYQMANYDKAKIYIEKVIALGEPSATVLEHYGDILFKLGQTEEALKQWIKAKSLGSDNEALERKIKNRDLE